MEKIKIQIRNFSNKKRSIRLKKELKEFTQFIGEEFQINNKIKLIKIDFKNEFRGYYPKNKPLAGFNYLYSKGIVRITLASFWNQSVKSMKKAIIHELTHTRQMIDQDLIIIKDKEILWHGKRYIKWKKFRFQKYDSFKRVANRKKYMNEHFPWEKEVQKNLKKYAKTQDII